MPGFPEHFTTARLAVARLTLVDTGFVRAMDLDARITALSGGIRSEEQTLDYMRAALAHWDRHGFGVLLLRDRKDGRPVGRAVLRWAEIEGATELELGYGFLPERWGQGLGTEITAALVDLAAARLDHSSIVALTDRENRASRRVLEKAGFAYERDADHRGGLFPLYRRPLTSVRAVLPPGRDTGLTTDSASPVGQEDTHNQNAVPRTRL